MEISLGFRVGEQTTWNIQSL